jgi:indole-3-glycerol phosphate synthase
VQASSHTWTPPGGTLGQIVAETAQRVQALLADRGALEAEAAGAAPGPSLAAALAAGGSVTVLAEVKRRSPSKGEIAPGLGAAAQARAYGAAGAAGVSILTEPLHFGGSPEDLRLVRAGLRIPILKKDFHVHPIQLLEARALGASAVLLIARAVSPSLLRELAAESSALGLEVLLEVRDEWELELAVEVGAPMIGVNNRNLETLAIDPATSARLVPRIPADRVAIAESGMRTHADVERAAGAGADAVLVGSQLSAAVDPAAELRGLLGVPRRARR